VCANTKRNIETIRLDILKLHKIKAHTRREND